MKKVGGVHGQHSHLRSGLHNEPLCEKPRGPGGWGQTGDDAHCWGGLRRSWPDRGPGEVRPGGTTAVHSQNQASGEPGHQGSRGITPRCVGILWKQPRTADVVWSGKHSERTLPGTPPAHLGQAASLRSHGPLWYLGLTAHSPACTVYSEAKDPCVMQLCAPEAQP